MCIFSAVPEVYEETKVLRPFLASSPATYLVNPSTTVSTLRPVIRQSVTTRTIVKTTVATTTSVPNFDSPKPNFELPRPSSEPLRPSVEPPRPSVEPPRPHLEPHRPNRVNVLSHGKAEGYPLPPIPTFRDKVKHL